MADVTISELADVVGVSVDKLLSQVKEAGLPHTKAEELISNDDKNALLVFLRRSHGDRESTDAAPKKITLKRKTIGTLKAASIHGRGKTVNVEVRKKRTYVKRSTIVDDTPPEESPTPEEEVLDTATTEAVSEAEPVSAEAVPDSAVAETKQAEEAEQETTEAIEVPVQDIPAPEAEAARAAKPGTKRKPSAKSDTDDPMEKKKTHLRAKAKAQQAPKRQAKTIHVNDDFVLEGDDFDELGGRARRGGGRKSKARLSAQQHAFEKPTEFISREISIGEANSLSDLAQQMSVKSAEIIKVLINMGVMATINQVLDQDTATLLIEEMGH
ncbi:MAG: translation initiation factor IF-2 N-terminal domain-containing protein, partial [Gammaproteobacteria bacterium]|nr:translation initiation factor IF-2 N-terminal domain-containing protein [Gammaproteobacteria bacterium]